MSWEELYTLTGTEAERALQALGTSSKEVLYAYDWLNHLHLFDQLQLLSILKFAGDFVQSSATRNTPCCLIIHDDRWVSYTGSSEFFEVFEGKTVSSLPQRCITHTMCDLHALFDVMQSRKARRERG